MMMTLVAFNAYLLNSLDITAATVCMALNEQGHTQVDDFIWLTDEDIKDICENCKERNLETQCLIHMQQWQDSHQQ